MKIMEMIVSKNLESELRYQEFRNVSENAITAWKNPIVKNPNNIPLLLRILLMANGVKLPIVPNIPPIDVINQIGSGGGEQ
jgi:hypothetical protein